jgi:hypothetical protein
MESEERGGEVSRSAVCATPVMTEAANLSTCEPTLRLLTQELLFVSKKAIFKPPKAIR